MSLMQNDLGTIHYWQQVWQALRDVIECIKLKPGWEAAIEWQSACLEKHAQSMVFHVELYKERFGLFSNHWAIIVFWITEQSWCWETAINVWVRCLHVWALFAGYRSTIYFKNLAGCWPLSNVEYAVWFRPFRSSVAFETLPSPSNIASCIWSGQVSDVFWGITVWAFRDGYDWVVWIVSLLVSTINVILDITFL